MAGILLLSLINTNNLPDSNTPYTFRSKKKILPILVSIQLPLPQQAENFTGNKIMKYTLLYLCNEKEEFKTLSIAYGAIAS